MTQQATFFEDIFSPLLANEWGRRVGWAMMIVMGLLSLFTLVSMPFYWYSDVQLTHARPSVLTSQSTFDQVAILSKKIPDRHLFGMGAGQQTSTMPITSLQLRLVGVIKATPESESRVIISESNQPGKAYQVGDELSSGVKVYAITPDGVILRNGERLEKLPLQRSALIFQGMPKKLLPEE